MAGTCNRRMLLVLYVYTDFHDWSLLFIVDLAFMISYDTLCTFT